MSDAFAKAKGDGSDAGLDSAMKISNLHE